MEAFRILKNRSRSSSLFLLLNILGCKDVLNRRFEIANSTISVHWENEKSWFI
jgi:hypothetical protein